MRIIGWILGGIVAAVLALAAAAWASPWPGVAAIRWMFGQGADAASAALEKHVPDGIHADLDILPDPADPDAAFDIYRPEGAGGRALPVILWVHGGAFVSGGKADIGNYARILAGQGFAVVSAGYTIAPEARFPTPVRQVSAVLAHLSGHAADYGIDPTRIVLAGDSAGAQIAAQVALTVTDPHSAAEIGVTPALTPGQVRGVILFCGPYDLSLIRGGGVVGLFLNTVTWAYSGRRDWRADPEFAKLTITDNAMTGFPPVFISAGNADPLLPHSSALADALASAGVPVDALFFPPDHSPALGHEYQFNLDTNEGQQALARAVAFARRVTDPMP
jgi:acetyl esterase